MNSRQMLGYGYHRCGGGFLHLRSYTLNNGNCDKEVKVQAVGWGIFATTILSKFNVDDSLVQELGCLLR